MNDNTLSRHDGEIRQHKTNNILLLILFIVVGFVLIAMGLDLQSIFALSGGILGIAAVLLGGLTPAKDYLLINRALAWWLSHGGGGLKATIILAILIIFIPVAYIAYIQLKISISPSTPPDIQIILPEQPSTMTNIPTDIPKPTSTPIPTPTPCSILPSTLSVDYYSFVSQNPCVQDQLRSSGPGVETVYSGAYQEFERGLMLYIDTDIGRVYALFPEGRFEVYENRWVYRRDPPYPPEMPKSPEGFYRPLNDFGLVWFNNENISRPFGWATMCEISGLAIYSRRFPKGIIVRIDGYITREQFTEIPFDEGVICNQEDLYRHTGKTFILFFSSEARTNGTWVGSQ